MKFLISLLHCLQKSIWLLKLPFLASLSSNFSTACLHMLSKLADKSAQKSSIFPIKAIFARSLFIVLQSSSSILLGLNPETAVHHEYGYTKPSYIDLAEWNVITPYLMPEDHPIKAKLDNFFSQKRITQSSKSLKAAGFKKYKPRNSSQTVVSTHPNFKGYIFKMFTDEQDLNGTEKLLNRVIGIQQIRQLIEEKGYSKIFATPKKWLYPLPEHPEPIAGSYRKNFILIAEDMKIMKRSANRKAWKSMAVTPQVLSALFSIMKEVGLADSAFPPNIPFSKVTGQIVFIDTEVIHNWPVYYKRLGTYLSKDMRKFWEKLTEDQ